MLKIQFVPLLPAALSALLLASPLAIAIEAHHPEQGGGMTKEPAPPNESAPAAGDSPATTGGSMKGSQGMMGSQQGAESPTGSGTGASNMMGGPGSGMMPGMMMGSPGGGMMPGMMGGPGGGMMPGMMRGPGGGMMPAMMRGPAGAMPGRGMGRGGMQDDDRGQSRMMRGGSGMKGHGGGDGEGRGHGMREKFRKLMGRLDLLEARMASMETMLERLLER